jgi:hypothetical protein
MESIKKVRNNGRRRPFGEDAIDNRQGAALTTMEKFSWDQLYLDDLAKIFTYFIFAWLFGFNILHAFC